MLLLLLFPGRLWPMPPRFSLVLAVSSAVSAAAAPATIALTADERGRAIAGLSFATFVIGSVAVVSLLPAYGLLGAAFGMLAVDVLGTLTRWALFLRGGKPAPEPKSGTRTALEC